MARWVWKYRTGKSEIDSYKLSLWMEVMGMDLQKIRKP